MATFPISDDFILELVNTASFTAVADGSQDELLPRSFSIGNDRINLDLFPPEPCPALPTQGQIWPQGLFLGSYANLSTPTPPNDQFRYYKFTEVTSNGNVYIVIGELQLRGAGDVILQGTYTTNMTVVGGSVTYLDDSNVNTAVAIPYPSNVPSDYIQVDLGTAQPVYGFRQSCLESLDKQIKTFKFSGSNNGTNWTVISPLVTMPDLPAIATLDATTVPLP